MGRRGENIRKRKDGRWEARIIWRYDLNGRAKYRSLYGKSYLEVKEKRNNLLKSGVDLSAGKGDQRRRDVTLGAVMREWLVSRKASLKESTFAHYTNLVEKHILPGLGGCCLAALTPEIIDTFLRRELRSGRMDGSGGLAPKTVADIRSVLLLGLEYASQHHYPCAVNGKIFYPKTQQPGVKAMTRAEQAKLEAVLFQHPEPLKLGILIALYGGLRIGEVCALQWGDFHFENGTIRINKTMLRIQNVDADCKKKTKVLISTPKTEHSNRVIPMPSFILNFLEPYSMGADIYILTGTRNYLEPRTCLDKYKKVLAQAGVESFSFHVLRHTFATRCVESGFDVKSLSEILGHANVNTTLQRYVHPSIELKREQMERLRKISVWGQNSGQEDHKKTDNIEVF